MKRTTTIKGSIGAVFVLLLLLFMTACGSSIDHVDLSEPANANDIPCSDTVAASNEFSRAENDGDQADLLDAWGITPREFKEAKDAVQRRYDACHGNKSASPSASSSPQPIKGTGTPVKGDCDTAFVQKFDPNKRGNFASNGVKSTKEELALMGRDARYLAFRAQNLGFVNTTDPSALLIPDNSCLSQEGVNVWNQVKGALTGMGVKADTHAKVPTNYHNTGMVDGKPVVDPDPGIGGDRSATKYTLRNGTVVYVMHRCANLGLPPSKVTDLPKGPTDHQRPPKGTPSHSTPPSHHPSSPPPGNEVKRPHQIPGNGGAGDGGGSKYGGTGNDRQTANPKPSKPAADQPHPTYGAPPPPKASKPPVGSKPTHTAAPPPPETGAGDDNTGDPGGF